MFVCDKEAIRMRGLGVDRTADECLLPMTLYVLLDCYDVVAQLLYREVVEVPRID